MAHFYSHTAAKNCIITSSTRWLEKNQVGSGQLGRIHQLVWNSDWKKGYNFGSDLPEYCFWCLMWDLLTFNSVGFVFCGATINTITVSLYYKLLISI